jgi:hypothetical protein
VTEPLSIKIRSMKKLFTIFLLVWVVYAQAQVKIGNNPSTINANSLLELESTDKGFLPPRVALNSLGSVSPLTGTVPAGMLVYSTGGTLIDGYYYWNGAGWVLLASGQSNPVIKTANATLTKLETFVLASNDITLTLPVVTNADNGLSITIKNIGTHTDLITVLGNGGALIDNLFGIALPRWFSLTMTANGGNWYFKERTVVPASTLEVSPYSSWLTLQEAIEFLNLHMWGPTVIKLSEGSFDISATQVIDLPYCLTIEGTSFGTTTIAAASGLANNPMFRCLSDCNFKMLQFDATTLSGYGTSAGEDAIRFVGSGTYNEIKDCTFDRFYNTILDSTNAELWVFETDISNAQDHGILIHSGVDSVNVKVAETDFINCKAGIHMSKGNKATIQLASGGYYNASASDTAIVYSPSTFTSSVSISIKGNLWNNTGKYIEGFDFTRSDGRDANAIVESNAGMGDKRSSCYINVINSAATTTLTTLGLWYKANWNYLLTTFSTSKWTVTNATGAGNVNRITYQPANRRDGWFIISGNLSVNQVNRTISLVVVKNGVTTTRYGETTIRTGSVSTPTLFSTTVYLSDIGPGDYFEIYCSTLNSGDVVTMLDVQWLADAK